MKRESYPYILVTQGKYQFYIVALPSSIFKDTCFAISRVEDPEQGFQRKLDENRANQIAEYIDHGLGSIPTAIILSAQSDAELQRNSRSKVLSFKRDPNAFLIIDGQHRIWGYQKSEKEVRVPVIIYEGLTRVDEARLFIDINENQKKVPEELIIDVKRLLELETEEEKVYNFIFDLFLKNADSVLKPYINVGENQKGNLSRIIFNNAIAELVKGRLKSLDNIKKYEVINNYLKAFNKVFIEMSPELKNVIAKTVVFQAILHVSEFAISIAYDKYENLTEESLYETIKAIKTNLSTSKIKNSGRSYRALSEKLREAMIKKAIPSTIITE